MPAFKRISHVALCTAVVAVLAATHSNAGDGACFGELTLERLATPACIARIAVPAPRPDGDRVAAPKRERLRKAAPVYIETQAPDGQGTRRVRLVGPRFLPDDGGEYDLRRPVNFASSPINAAFFRVAAMLMPKRDAGGTAVAAKDRDSAIVEARANLAERLAN